MAHSPQRPYIPHRTPTRGQPAVSSSDFTLARPFVPDAQQMKSAVVEKGTRAESQVDEPATPTIEAFLAAPPAAPTPASDLFDESESAEAEELPPLEHFLDPLPPITDFATSELEAEAEWVETDWQRYDWQSVAALGDSERTQDEASSAWASTDWEVPGPRMADRAKNPADAIATALDQIAERIRNGDLSLPGSGGVADPATIAATLAALLGVRR